MTPAQDGAQVNEAKSGLGRHTWFGAHGSGAQGPFTQARFAVHTWPGAQPKKKQLPAGWHVPSNGAQACPAPHEEAPKHGS